MFFCFAEKGGKVKISSFSIAECVQFRSLPKELPTTLFILIASTLKSKKAKLAKDIANGVMLWEKWQDATDGNSLLKAACDTVGRSY